MNVILILNNAPDYRESFLRGLSKYINLTVFAFPCNDDFLVDPKKRIGYVYNEIKYSNFVNIRFSKNLPNKKELEKFDVIIASLNLRNITIIKSYLISNKNLKKKWIWWGQIFSSNPNFIFETLKIRLLKNCAHILVYSENIKLKLNDVGIYNVTSFNNSDVEVKDIQKQEYLELPTTNLIFVGRYQKRKKLERIITLMNHFPDLRIKLIGPGIKENLKIEKKYSKRIQIFDKISGIKLKEHFDWAHISINPGHLGLFVMNSAKFAKMIIIDSNSSHAPEYILAKKTQQPFIDFENIPKSKSDLEKIFNNKLEIKKMGIKLQEELTSNYTVENMIKVHLSSITKIFKINNS